MTSRIRYNYIHGIGDMGFSRLLADEEPIIKSSVICALYGEIEEAQSRIGDVLNLELRQDDVVDILNQLYQELFNLSAFCYFKGGRSDFEVKAPLFVAIDKRTQELQEELGDCPDFLVFKHDNTRLLNKVRVSIRKIEHLFWSWKDSSEVASWLQLHPASEKAVGYQGAFLNRLSAWLFHVTRKEGLLVNQVETYWKRHLDYSNDFDTETKGAA